MAAMKRGECPRGANCTRHMKAAAPVAGTSRDYHGQNGAHCDRNMDVMPDKCRNRSHSKSSSNSSVDRAK